MHVVFSVRSLLFVLLCLLPLACGDSDGNVEAVTDDADSGTIADETGASDEAVTSDSDISEVAEDLSVERDELVEDSVDDAENETDGEPERITLELVEGCNPFSTSEDCLLPFPSRFFQDEDTATATGFRVNIPQSALPIESGGQTIDLAPINTADGCSPAGPILMHFGADIDPMLLTRQSELLESVGSDNPMALFDLETGRRVMFMSEMDMNRDPSYEDRYALIVRPMEPMEMGHRHVFLLTHDMQDDEGNALESPAGFAALRDSVLTTNEVIEEVRDHYESLFEFLEVKGYPRDELLLAWDFMVASEDYLTGSVRSMREQALDEMAGIGLEYTVDEVDDDPNDNTARLVEGTFSVPTFLNEDNAFEYDDDHHPIRQDEDLSFPYTMLIPKIAETSDEPLPLIIFGHGLFGTGRDSLAGGGLATMSALAEEGGMIMVATDWIGLSGGDLNLIISQVIPDMNRIVLVTDRIQQSIINNLTLTELAIGALSSDERLQVGSGELIDEGRIYYVGGSLGGIQGSSFVSMSSRVTRAALAVPGCGWLNMLTRSTHWNRLDLIVDLHYPDPLLKQIGIALIQALFDLSDPVNLTRHLYASPLEDAPEERILLLHEAIGDSQVPNLASEMLARAIGAKILEPSVYSVPGLVPVTSPTTESVLVQVYMRDRVEADPPPEENVPPRTDNGVHGRAPFLEHMMEQNFHFLQSGEIVHACTGACDPD